MLQKIGGKRTIQMMQATSLVRDFPRFLQYHHNLTSAVSQHN
jgi:hypothetical protein